MSNNDNIPDDEKYLINVKYYYKLLDIISDERNRSANLQSQKEITMMLHRSHNVTQLIYHVVFAFKYRRPLFDRRVLDILGRTFERLAAQYEVAFLEVGADSDHIHLLVQTPPKHSVTSTVRLIKSLTAIALIKEYPEIYRSIYLKPQGKNDTAIWSRGYYAANANAKVDEIRRYIRNQGEKRCHN